MPKSKNYKSMKEKHQRFSWTQPVGYNFDDVEEAIEQYDKTIEGIKGVIEQKDATIAELEAEINRLEGECARLNTQLVSFTIPETQTAESSLDILNDFAGDNVFDEKSFEETSEEAETQDADITQVLPSDDEPEKEMKLPPLIQ